MTVGKGSYFKKPDYKSKGRMGIRKMYCSHLRVTLQARPRVGAPTRERAFAHARARAAAGGEPG